MYSPGTLPTIMTRNLVVRSVAKLPTSFNLKVTPPFSINRDSFSLKPNQEETLRVDFDPSLKIEKHSYVSRNKLQIIHKDHPMKDNVDLIGTVCYPNLAFEYGQIDFGCIQNNSSKKI